MDELVRMVIAGAPNVAVAVLMLYWQQQRINRLEGHILDLNNRLTRAETMQARPEISTKNPS